MDANTTVELDLDGDGVFEEDITSYVLSVESVTGRDRASQLSGKAGPGKLSVLVDNNDNRFSDFNVSSPYYGLLVPGRHIRWRDSSAVADDPVQLARDRFGRADGALGTTENSITWDATGSLAHFTIEDERAVPGTVTVANVSQAAITAPTSAYIQVQVAQLGTGNNVVGLCFRYFDDNDYSILVVDVAQSAINMIDVTSGTQAVIASVNVELYSGMTIGVFSEPHEETIYLEGVAIVDRFFVGHGFYPVAGLYATWESGQTAPALDDLEVWDHLPVEVDGIFWTGRLVEPRPTVSAGPFKTATIEAIGPLAELARQAVSPPTSLEGKQTGLLMGNVLALAGQLRPPGPIEIGDVTTGLFIAERWSYAINIARNIEETELGFLYETQEGYIGFRGRSHNDSITEADVLFSDVP